MKSTIEPLCYYDKTDCNFYFGAPEPEDAENTIVLYSEEQLETFRKLCIEEYEAEKRLELKHYFACDEVGGVILQDSVGSVQLEEKRNEK